MGQSVFSHLRSSELLPPVGFPYPNSLYSYVPLYAIVPEISGISDEYLCCKRPLPRRGNGSDFNLSHPLLISLQELGTRKSLTYFLSFLALPAFSWASCSIIVIPVLLQGGGRADDFMAVFKWKFFTLRYHQWRC